MVSLRSFLISEVVSSQIDAADPGRVAKPGYARVAGEEDGRQWLQTDDG